MSELHSYPKVLVVGHPWVANVFDGPVVIEEKVDGSQFSFGVRGGTLFCRSKGKELDMVKPEGMFLPAVETAIRIRNRLCEGYTYRCELLSKPKHNTIAYGRVPAGNIVLFDVDRGSNAMTSRADKESIAGALELEIVPVLFEGKINGMSELTALLDTVSFLGGAKIEGIVIKNYAKFMQDGKFMCAKVVSEEFKERHAIEWKQTNPGPTDIRDKIAESLCTEARWNKCVQRMRDDGTLTGTPKDIGALVRLAQEDTIEECKAVVIEELWQWARDSIRRKSVAGLPEWYKNKIMVNAFEVKA